MAIKRLTNLFFAEQELGQIWLDLIANGVPRGRVVSLPDGLIVSSDFPFVLDEDLALYRSARNSDATAQADGTLSLDPSIVTSNGRYNDQDWFLGLAINGRVVWNGIPRPVTVNQEGTTDQFTYVYLDDRVAISHAEFINNGQGARIEIDLRRSNLGLLDVLEVAIIKANIWTPWIYYGNIPARQQIAYEVFNRTPASMGGIPESLTPSQAVGYRYYVDFSLSSDYDPILVPSVSLFFLPTFGSGGVVNEQFFMGDILDGSGQVAARSACTFKVLSISQNIGIGGASAQALNIINTGAFRTLNYRPIEYRKQTYDNKEVIENTTFYLAFKDDADFGNVYANLSETLRVLLGTQIDFETCKFRSYIYGIGTASSWDGVSEDIDALADSILGIAESVFSGPTGERAPISNVFSIVKADAASDYSADLNDFVNESEDNDPNSFFRNYSFIAFGDMIFPEDDSIIESETLNTSIDGVIYSKKMTTGGGQIIFEPGAEALGTATIGSNVNQIFGYKNSSVYGFQFLETLAQNIGILLTEDSIYEEFEYFNAPVVKGQCNRVIAPRTPTSTTVNFDFGASDIDGDGTISFLDRIYELYSGFNPSIDEGEDSFFGSRGTEMRYWRRMCPIGNMFEFTGQIESITKQRGNNYLCKVKILVLDEETNTYVDSPTENNLVWVYYEDGATTDSGGGQVGDAFSFRGRLFFPKYFVNGGQGISLGSGVNLIDPGELTAWYRVGVNTSKDLIDYGTPGHNMEDDPVIVIRSNIAGGTDSDLYPHASGISQNPFNSTEEQQFFAISQSSERVQDHALTLDITQEDDDIVFGKPPLLDSYDVFSSGTAINFQSIEFQIEVDDPGENGSLENRGLYFFNVEYKPINDDNYYPMAKFWSAEALGGGELVSNVKIDLSLPQTYGTRLANVSGGNDQIYAITFPYSSHSQESGGILHLFEFLSDNWNVRVLKNGQAISSIVKDDLTLSEDSFEGRNAKVTPGGYVVLREQLDSTESIFVEFTNKSGNQVMLKTGTDIRIVLGRYYPQAEGQVIIRNVRVNTTELKSIERVDVHYSNRTQSATHFVAPAFGFAVVSSRGWNLNQDDANNTAGGAFSTRITGFLESPNLYFDAFSNDTGEKTITASSSRDIPAIDIVYSNMVSVSTQPFMELFSVGYAPPPAETLPKVAAHIDEDANRFTIYYAKDDRMIKKESINLFLPKRYVKGYRDNTRWEYPIYAGFDDDVRELGFSASDSGYSISLSGQRGFLVGLRLTTSEIGDKENFNDVTYFNLFGNEDPLGYERYDGQRSSLAIPVRSHLGFDGGYVMLPDTTGLSSVTIELEEDSEFSPSVEKVEGFFIDAYVEGSAPNTTLSSRGLYMLFFERSDSNQVLGLLSNSHAYRWNRPATLDTDRERFGSPIPMLSGYVNPILIDDNGDRNLYIFVYDNNSASISLMVVPQKTFMKISIGAGEESEADRINYEQETDPDNPLSITSLTQDPQTKEWFKVYSSGRKLLPIAQSASRDFSAAQVKSGRLYMAYRTLDDEVKILFTSNTSYNELREENLWIDVGIDLLSEDSNLGRVLEKFGGIYSMTLSSPLDEDKLYLLIATNDSKLLFFDLPEPIARLSADLEKVETPLRNALQREINRIKPSLIIGVDSGEPDEDLIKSDFLNKDFEKQIASLVWNKKREGFLVFLDNGNVRALKTTARGQTWSDYKEV